MTIIDIDIDVGDAAGTREADAQQSLCSAVLTVFIVFTVQRAVRTRSSCTPQRRPDAA